MQTESTNLAVSQLFSANARENPPPAEPLWERYCCRKGVQKRDPSGAPERRFAAYFAAYLRYCGLVQQSNIGFVNKAAVRFSYMSEGT